MFGKNLDPDFELFSIYDSKAGFYREPSFAINRHELLRQIENLMRDPSQQRHQLVLNAEDFSVFKVGDYTKKTGKLQGCNPEHVANLHDIRSMIHREMANTPPPPISLGSAST